MKTTKLAIPDVVMITPQKHGDARGYFSETYNAKRFKDALGPLNFVQDNQAFSAQAGTLRGLHFQTPPKAQGKLIRVLKGAIFDVAVDLRAGSPTYGEHVTATLSAENFAQLWVPAGFGHGYCTLQPDTEVFYKVTDFYSPAHDRGLAWDDPALAIRWPLDGAPELSEKDKTQPRLADLGKVFD